MIRTKKSKKQKRPIEQVPRFEIIKLQNLLHISIMVRVLWTVYGWREKRIGYFLEAYMSLLGEVWDQRCTVSAVIAGEEHYLCVWCYRKIKKSNEVLREKNETK